VQLALWDQQVHEVLLALQEQTVLLVPLAQQVLKDQLVLLEQYPQLPVHVVLQELLVLQDLKVQRHKFLDQKVTKDQQAPLV
jgi:hypothetical protein